MTFSQKVKQIQELYGKLYPSKPFGVNFAYIQNISQWVCRIGGHNMENIACNDNLPSIVAQGNSPFEALKATEKKLKEELSLKRKQLNEQLRSLKQDLNKSKWFQITNNNTLGPLCPTCGNKVKTEVTNKVSKEQLDKLGINKNSTTARPHAVERLEDSFAPGTSPEWHDLQCYCSETSTRNCPLHGEKVPCDEQ
jgi:hypothetical protein